MCRGVVTADGAADDDAEDSRGDDSELSVTGRRVDRGDVKIRVEGADESTEGAETAAAEDEEEEKPFEPREPPPVEMLRRRSNDEEEEEGPAETSAATESAEASMEAVALAEAATASSS